MPVNKELFNKNKENIFDLLGKLKEMKFIKNRYLLSDFKISLKELSSFYDQ